MPKREVEEFLDKVHECLNYEFRCKINDEKWVNGRVNKTQLYLAEKNLKERDVAQTIRKLNVTNYSYTSDDRNNRFPNEVFWIFGISKTIIDKLENLYIKLKIRKVKEIALINVMSFHPEQVKDEKEKLKFPYKGNR